MLNKTYTANNSTFVSSKDLQHFIDPFYLILYIELDRTEDAKKHLFYDKLEKISYKFIQLKIVNHITLGKLNSSKDLFS